MHIAHTFYFDCYQQFLHDEILNIPGKNPTAVREFIKEHHTRNVLGTPVAFAFVMFEDSDPLMVVM